MASATAVLARATMGMTNPAWSIASSAPAAGPPPVAGVLPCFLRMRHCEGSRLLCRAA
jgi:hypothetical protein